MPLLERIEPPAAGGEHHPSWSVGRELKDRHLTCLRFFFARKKGENTADFFRKNFWGTPMFQNFLIQRKEE